MKSSDDVLVSEKDPAARLPATRTRIEPGSVWVGPAGHLADERERLAALDWHSFDLDPAGVSLGANISGIDLSAELTAEVVAELRRALNEFKVLFFRDQRLNARRHTAFAAGFGELEIHPFIPGNKDEPELVQFEKGPDVTGYENLWHHDVTWRATPSLGAILRAVDVPVVGGDTLFCDMAAAYDGLEPDLKEQIDGLGAVNDFMMAFGKNVPDDKRADIRAKYPEVVHPVVRVHPETGRRCLFVNRIFTREIVGMKSDDSVALLDLLYREADQPEYQVRFHWEENSVAFWDNRSVQHYAASDYWPQIRVMERASIRGDRPIGTPEYEEAFG